MLWFVSVFEISEASNELEKPHWWKGKMGHLDKLNISRRVIAAARPRRKLDTVEYRREKLIANVEEQIELANLKLQGKPAQIKRKRGHDIVTVRPRLWWATEPDGHVYTQIRYNKVPLNILGQGTSIEVGPLKKLPSVYKTVIRAIEAGELDNSIDNAAKKSRR
ncbi:MAG: hypothetical protein HKN28_17485 [Alphaproteobacteria bacterium]|nr:hypothetical protein [Alphaproteobacteria bacterium]